MIILRNISHVKAEQEIRIWQMFGIWNFELQNRCNPKKSKYLEWFDNLSS